MIEVPIDGADDLTNLGFDTRAFHDAEIVSIKCKVGENDRVDVIIHISSLLGHASQSAQVHFDFLLEDAEEIEIANFNYQNVISEADVNFVPNSDSILCVLFPSFGCRFAAQCKQIKVVNVLCQD